MSAPRAARRGEKCFAITALVVCIVAALLVPAVTFAVVWTTNWDRGSEIRR